MNANRSFESSENTDSLDSLKLRRAQMLAQFMLRTGTNLDCADLREQLLRVDSLIHQAERENAPEGKLNLALQLVVETKAPPFLTGQLTDDVRMI